MTSPGWSQAASPFHAGELAIQAKVGAQERIDRQGRRIIREYLTEQHRQFFAQLPYVTVGTVDGDGRPWASILVGPPGFLSTPDEQTLHVNAQPLFGDPLAHTLGNGVDIGCLGIELHTRRRNRLNGIVRNHQSHGFDVEVGQSFGNCPQYIQARMFESLEFDPMTSKPTQTIAAFSAIEQAMITAADTFFITTAYQAASAGMASGVDVSHRGGNPGFVRIDDDRTLTIPDFSGNFHFNTFGNLALNPRSGILFIDFTQGHLLYLTGTAEVIWEGDEITDYAGAERLLRFHLETGIRVEGSLPIRWSPPEFSPFLEKTGNWPSQS
ncbi:pyridoxamine 5'-phosphate oxidase family protein [filamentous cyanobacterium LEGE 11480]|uniref:Pyridoxamine 5'-phosphate oxidase family protein n=1 Tax=Romeriopsis navalis LEGE 11480 TaxID=2777977 RepID=A0A928VLI4_9CYAN|nr:pyridoxamine 5'-phosphate oxidase family protein [Romeriopsis navalis]MBE9029847.1 pyridoxamine 5'-phosphate oxidase family protein [Romeriopsis navalis LEGE 11480]